MGGVSAPSPPAFGSRSSLVDYLFLLVLTYSQLEQNFWFKSVVPFGPIKVCSVSPLTFWLYYSTSISICQALFWDFSKFIFIHWFAFLFINGAVCIKIWGGVARLRKLKIPTPLWGWGGFLVAPVNSPSGLCEIQVENVSACLNNH